MLSFLCRDDIIVVVLLTLIFLAFFRFFDDSFHFIADSLTNNVSIGLSYSFLDRIGNSRQT